MNIDLTSEEIGFLKQLAAAGAVGRTMAGQSRAGLSRLVQLRYVNENPVSLDSVLYFITAIGRNALAQAEQPK